MIAIPAMEKPKTCAECDCNYFEGFKGYESNYCSALKRPYNNNGFEINPFKERLHDCQLIEIDESEMEYLYREFGLEKDENLTERAKELKRAILMGYLYAKTGERRTDE